MSIDGARELHYRIDLAFADLMNARVETEHARISFACSDRGRRDLGCMDLFVQAL